MSQWNPILNAIRTIAGVCDGANSRDNQGFDGADTYRGKSLASMTELSTEEARIAWEMLKKYTRQLEGAGIDHACLPEPPALDTDQAEAAKQSIRAHARKSYQPKERIDGRVIRANCDKFLLAWPYTDVSVLVPKMKEYFPERRYEKTPYKHWQIPANPVAIARLLDFAGEFGFEIEDAAVELYDRVMDDAARSPAVEAPKPAHPDRVIRLGQNKKGELCAIITNDFVKAIYDIVSNLDGREFVNEPKKGWAIPFKHSGRLLEIAEEYHFNMTPELRGTLMQEQDKAEAANTAAKRRKIALLDGARDIPNGNFGGKTPREYQVAGVSFLLEAIGKYEPTSSAILADDMGLGKTFEGMLLARAFQRAFSAHIFIICPKSLKGGWIEEAAACEMRAEVYTWAKVPKPVNAPFIVIADEAHYMQNLKSARTKAALALAEHPQCLAFIPVTGTPMRGGRPINLFPLLKAIKHPLGRNWKSYTDYYCAATTREVRTSKGYQTIRDLTGAAHLDQLMKEIAPVFLRRTKDKVLKDLPPKVRTVREVEVSEEAAAIYTKAFAGAQAKYNAAKLVRMRVRAEEEGTEFNPLAQEGSEAIVLLTNLRQAASIAKVEGCIEIADEVLEQGRKVIIFTISVEAAEKLASYYRKQGIQCEVLTGESKDRDAMKERFQRGNSRVWISTIKAGGVGLTLTAADTVILLDQAWMWDDCIQAEDRAHRKDDIMAERIAAGPSSVNVYWLKAFEIDAKIQARLFEQKRILESVEKGNRSTLRGMKSIADLAREVARELFEGKKAA